VPTPAAAYSDGTGRDATGGHAVDPHSNALIETMALSLGAAFVGGVLARLARLPVIVGYMLAGIAIGPYTPGLVADPAIVLELAEIGVALLMFGVGLHFSFGDLLAVRSVALPGALGQIAVAVALGAAATVALGGGIDTGIVVGIAISVASTVVLLRNLADRGLLMEDAGRTAVGWLIVEDLVTVLVLVVLPAIATVRVGGATDAVAIAVPILVALAKAGALLALMVVLGPRVLPRALEWVERMGSQELFTLALLGIALGITFAATVVFGVSLALGAFLAGAVLSESKLRTRAEGDVRTMTEVFTVLFFVSVGMLLDPAVLMQQTWEIIVVLAVVVVGKALAALAIVALRGAPARTGLTVAAGLAQIGEFSFIVAAAAFELHLVPELALQVIVAVALISITINPLLFMAIEPLEGWLARRPRLGRWLHATTPVG
jgi:CPA2 family monovalent cation:H+ antiporter-2